MKKVWVLLIALTLCAGSGFADSASDYPGMKEMLKLIRSEDEEADIAVDFIGESTGQHSIIPRALIISVYDDCVLVEDIYGAYVCVPLDKIRFIDIVGDTMNEKRFLNAAEQLEKEMERK